jgi:hypothetical protein
MVIQELTQRTTLIETAICNAKWKPRNRGQRPTESTDNRKRDEKHNTEEDREKEAKWLS